MNGPECAAWVLHERIRGLRLGASLYEVYRGVDEGSRMNGPECAAWVPHERIRGTIANF